MDTERDQRDSSVEDLPPPRSMGSALSRSRAPLRRHPEWAIPLDLGPEGLRRGGFPASLRYPGSLEEAARLVLEVVPGERPFLPEFGCRLHGLPRLESSEDRQLGATLIEEAIARWIPDLGVTRAEIADVRSGQVTVRLRAWGAWQEVRITHRFHRFRWLAGDREEPGDAAAGPAERTSTRETS